MEARAVTIPEQRTASNGLPFPLILEPSTGSPTNTEEFLQYLKSHRDELESMLLSHGAILFRGFGPTTATHMNDVFYALGCEDLHYVGGAAPRTNVVGAVHTANESPPESIIPFHHEMGQSSLYPQRLFFFCEREPSTGGATPIVLSHEVYRHMETEHPGFVRDVQNKGLMYRRIIPEEDDPTSAQGRGVWNTFQVKSKTREEAHANAATIGVTLEWRPDGNVTTTSKVGGVREYRGRNVWFNSMVAAYTGWTDVRNKGETAVTFQDGTPLDRSAVLSCRDAMERLCVTIPWRVGDVLYIDNNQTMHSRQSFTGPRRILACLAKSPKHAAKL